jgi:hypothetical protein
MRHVLSPGAPATGTRRMVQAPAAARLVALAGGALRLAPRVLCTAARTVDLAAVAAAADQHLSPAAHAHEQPRRRCLRLRQCRTWTRAATSGILPRHACSARCGARRRSQTCRFRSAPCPSIRQVVTAPSVRSNPRHRPQLDRATRAACGYVDNASALPTYPQAQQTAASVILIVLKQQASTAPACHISTAAGPTAHRSVTMPLRHFCADPDSHSQGRPE